jgi:hypothetical protein
MFIEQARDTPVSTYVSGLADDFQPEATAWRAG